MAETDPVVVRLIVENGTFLADINNSARVVDRQFGHMEGNAISLERQMRSSLSSMSAAFKSAASTFAVGFSIGQVGQLADTFTRIQNSLKVAGLAGENLERVQASLLPPPASALRRSLLMASLRVGMSSCSRRQLSIPLARSSGRRSWTRFGRLVWRAMTFLYFPC